MEQKDNIKELFASKLGNHEMPVNPNLWGSVASKIGTSKVVATSSFSKLSKILIGLGATSALSVATYFVFMNDEKTIQNQPLTTLQNTLSESSSEVQNEIINVEKSTQKTTIELDNKQILKDKDILSKQENAKNEYFEIVNSHDESTLIENRIIEDKETFISTPSLISQKNEPIIHKEEVVEKAKLTVIEEKNTTLHSAIQAEQHGFEITLLPNVFVLNANGYFSIEYSGAYKDFQITIMDTKNNVIFRSNQADFKWKGENLSGEIVEPGKYIYIITAVDNNNNAVNKYSYLTVLMQ